MNIQQKEYTKHGSFSLLMVKPLQKLIWSGSESMLIIDATDVMKIIVDKA